MIRNLLPLFLFGGLNIFLFYALPKDQIFWLVIICPVSFIIITKIFEKLIPKKELK